MQSELLDRELGSQKRFGLRLHVSLCAWCRRYGKQIRFLRQAMRDHPDMLSDAEPQVLSPEARERLKRALRDQAD